MKKDWREQATILLARRATTIKRWSLDTRSEGQFAYSRLREYDVTDSLIELGASSWLQQSRGPGMSRRKGSER